jgi:adenosylhomocysteine nucleosidase
MNQHTPKSKPLIIVAIKEESNGYLENHGLDVLYTGLGKVNAAYRLTKELLLRAQNNTLPSIIINFGTAGSRLYKQGQLVACSTFVQRDMDVSGLGFPIGETPFEHHPSTISHRPIKTGLSTGLCGTGDSFEIEIPKVKCDVVDMEAYALAKVCYFENIHFISIKYISDGSDESASQDWNQNINSGAILFCNWFNEYKNEFMNLINQTKN